jgi:RNA polymerase sigma-70 factor (ECF subfamily)
MNFDDPQTAELLDRAERGDASVVNQLLASHRQRLKAMVSLRLDARIRSRADPSDVVQDALLDAARRLPEFLSNRSVPFYLWLRQIAAERLVDLHRRHIRARNRSVAREQPWAPAEESSWLAERLAGDVINPSKQLLVRELRHQVTEALDKLSPRDREVLVLTYLEQLKAHEIALLLGTSEGAINMRHLRALKRLKTLLPGSGDSA